MLRSRTGSHRPVDISLPPAPPHRRRASVIKTTNEMVRVFQKLGYSVAEGRCRNGLLQLEALNFPRIIGGMRRYFVYRGSRGGRSGSGCCWDAYFSVQIRR